MFLNEKRSKDESLCNQADAAAYFFFVRENKRASTVNRRLASLRCYYNFLVSRQIIKENPFQGIKAPKILRNELEYLSLEEMDRLLDIKKDSKKSIRDSALLETLYATGMRASELCECNIKDLNLKIGYVSCFKENNSRLIPIGKSAMEALELYLSAVRGASDKDIGDQALFVNMQGERITRQGIWKILRECGKRAGIEKNVSPQMIRSSFAVHMAQNGADPKTLQELLGLDDINAVNVYITATKKRIMDVYDRTHPRA